MKVPELVSTDLQISAEWKKPKETSRCTISYKAAVVGPAPWAERQFEEVEKKEIVIGSANEDGITDGLERGIEQVRKLVLLSSNHINMTCATCVTLQLVKGQSALITVSADYSYGATGLNGKVK